jgi:hypothetical protein
MLNDRQQTLDTERVRIARMTKPMVSCLWSVPIMIVLLPSVLFGSGCASSPETTQRGHVLYVQIRDVVSPLELDASVGDEIRWQNLRSDPVKIGLLDTYELKDVSCARGFTHFGLVYNFAIIAPNDYVSLCVSHRGTIQYNVWMDPDDMIHTMTRTATIYVEGAS